jgi:cupin fold WbuC family metalloprotein
MKIIDDHTLDQLSQEARRSPRLRKNLNLHPRELSTCHRFLNAIEPGSYIRPHRHLDPEKDETLVVVRGALGVASFDETGAITGQVLLRPEGPMVVDLPHGQYHCALALEGGTVFLETKAGPYLPLSDQEKAPFAPEEDSPEAAEFVRRMTALFP